MAEPPHLPVLTSQLSELDTATSQLLETIDILRRRLEPVCKAEEPTDKTPSACDPTTGVPFGDQLLEQRKRVESARRKIEMITESVEL